ELTSLIALFEANPRLKPWFPAILIGDDFEAAKQLLDAINPSTLVTNNSGVGFYAQSTGLNWIAGPQMNTTNSYSLKCLNDEYQASG
ncbi:U32 family peptidase, partial [Vibrio alfacsensis]